MKVIGVNNAEPTIVLELTQSELGTLISAFGISSGSKREEYAKENNVKVLDYRYPNDKASDLYSDLTKFYDKTFK